MPAEWFRPTTGKRLEWRRRAPISYPAYAAREVISMRIVVIAGAASLFALLGVSPRTIVSEHRLKDRAAMIVYEGRDRVLSVLPYADTANLALILFTQIQGDSVSRASLTGRPCIGLALFSKNEWAQLTATRRPTDVRPSEAFMRLRLYPARTGSPAAVQHVQTGEAYVALGLEYAQNGFPPTKWPSLKWSVQTYLDSARGPCTAE
jgi:hypothetical protein